MPSPKDISAIWADDRKILAAMRRGVRKALIRHIQMDLPVVEWRDGKTVYVYPAELKKLVRSMGRGGSRRKIGGGGQVGSVWREISLTSLRPPRYACANDGVTVSRFLGAFVEADANVQ